MTGAPTPGEVFGAGNVVCRVRVAGGRVYQTKRMTLEDAKALAEEIGEAVSNAHRVPVIHFDAVGYEHLIIPARSVGPIEVVLADTAGSAPTSRWKDSEARL